MNSNRTPRKRWEIPQGPPLVLLLAGKTGNGKSSTGNSILGRGCFQKSPRGASVTRTFESGRSIFNNRRIEVADVPGFLDTKLSDQESKEQVMTAFSEAVKRYPDGINAVALVFRFGTRMTKEETTCFKSLKSMLGDDILRHHGVCIFTCGDNFAKEVDGSFEDWLQDGDVDGGGDELLEEVLRECQDRCILFNNFAEQDGCPEVALRQRYDLIQLVDGLGPPYTGGAFKKAKEEWQMREAEKTYETIKSEYFQELGEIHAVIASEKDKKNGFQPDIRQDILRRLKKLKDKTKFLKGDDQSTQMSNLTRIIGQMQAIDDKMTKDPNYNPKDDMAHLNHVFWTSLASAGEALTRIVAKPFAYASGGISSGFSWASSKLSSGKSSKPPK